MTSAIAHDGTISANGGNGAVGNGCSGGAGSGGSVWVSSNTALSGSGLFSANGGNSSNTTYDGGGGGGGRVSIAFDTSTFVTTALTVRASGGTSASGGDALRGTTVMVDRGANAGAVTDDALYIPHGFRFEDSDSVGGAHHYASFGTEPNAVVYTGAQAEPIVVGGAFDLGNSTSWAPLSADITAASFSLGTGATLIAAGSVAVDAATGAMASTSRLEGSDVTADIDTHTMNGSAKILAAAVTITGADWTLNDTASLNGDVDATLDTLDVCAGCAFSANGWGEARNVGAGAGGDGGSQGGGGGGHGGLGGNGQSGGAGGATYGDPDAPVTDGSGGGDGCGSSKGGSGGGVIALTLSDTLTNHGTISANGSGGSVGNGCYGGGGAGGSVKVSATTLAGSGTFTALGGVGGNSTYDGGGGGGRIALTYTTLTHPTPGAGQVAGGSSPSGGDGSAGTVRLTP